MEYISSRSDTILIFSRVKMLKLYHFENRYIPYPLKTNTFSFYCMLLDDERMELFSVFVPVHTRTNLYECPIQTQFVRHIEKL